MAKGKLIAEGRNLSKAFGKNVVLEDVSIQCYEGEAVALSGENGAGKSTLMNIISGGLQPTSGQVLVDGREQHFKSPSEAKRLGIAFVHQELSLMDEMTVGENILLGIEPRRHGIIQQKLLHRQAAEILKEVGFSIDVNLLVKNISPAEKQIVEIAKAWAIHPRIIIFDEPTSSLNSEEAEILFDFIKRIKKKSVSVILISHRMEDNFAACDRIVVLKDGRFVFSADTRETTVDEIVSKMVGRKLSAVYPSRNKAIPKEITLQLQHVSMGSKVQDVSLEVPAGTIIGIGGLEGQGQRELARAIFGIEPFTSGKVLLKGRQIRIDSPITAVKNKIAYVSDDRKAEGLFLPLSTGENIVSLVLDQHQRRGIVREKELDKEAAQGIEQLHIKVAGPGQLVKSLSGGNQQKIVFSKWIKAQPRILILHEPTRGIDVQSKLEIYQIVRDLTKQGASILLFTSDMLELIGLSDRIFVMYEGRITGSIDANEATEEKIMMLSTNTAGDKL